MNPVVSPVRKSASNILFIFVLTVKCLERFFPPNLQQPNYHPNPNSSTSNAHHVDSESGPRKHAQWTDYETQIFVTVCEIVIDDGHRNGKCFTKYGWQTLVNLFDTNSGHNWSKQQLKNRWDALRLKHKRFEELINSSGVAYDKSTGLISASAEWWDRKMKERKEYNYKDCRELYRCKVLFRDVFDCDKYAVTPSQACCIGFAMFEDSAHEDHHDEIPVDVESSGSSDEGGVAAPRSAARFESGPHSGDKRKVVGKRSKEKRKNFSSRDVSYSVDRATSASEKIATKIDHFIGAAMSNPKT